MKRVTLGVALVVLAIALPGCTPAQVAAPTCDGEGRRTVVLMAQSVPEADLVPCIDALPGGWSIVGIEVKSGHTRLQLGPGPGGGAETYVTVDFEPSCEVGEAVEVPSDDEGAQRFEDVSSIDNGYRGSRYYTFAGGCVRHTFNVSGDGWSAIVNDAAAAFALQSRTELERYIREYSNGVIEHL